MDLFCPHCSRRVTVPDDKAGKVMSCPLCTKQFMAPSLPPPPVAPKPPPPVSSAPAESYGVSAGPAPLPGIEPAAGPKPASPPSQPAPAPASGPPPPPPPPGDYSRSFVLYLNDTWLAFVPSGCVLLIIVLSIFIWHSPIADVDQPSKSVPALSLWGLSFNEKGQGQFLAYFILMLPTWLLTFLALPFDKGWIQAPPPLALLMGVKNLLIGLLLGIGFLLLGYDYLDGNLFQKSNPIAWPMKVAIRLQFLAVVASFLIFWMHWRKTSNLPLPKCEFRW
jgi:hypothetical protein